MRWFALSLITLAPVHAKRPAPEPEAPLVWPPPPDPARVRSQGEIVTSRWARLGRSALGDRAFGGRDRRPPRGRRLQEALRGDHRQSRPGLRVRHRVGPGAGVRNRAERWFGWVGDSGQGALSKPAGITVDARDHLLVADLGQGAVFEYDPAGDFVQTWGSGRLTRPVAGGPQPGDQRAVDHRQPRAPAGDRVAGHGGGPQRGGAGGRRRAVQLPHQPGGGARWAGLRDGHLQLPGPGVSPPTERSSTSGEPTAIPSGASPSPRASRSPPTAGCSWRTPRSTTCRSSAPKAS